MIKLKSLISEATYVKGKMHSIINYTGKQLINSLIGNITDSPSVEDSRIKIQAAKKAKREMERAYDKFVKEISKISKPFDDEITGR